MSLPTVRGPARVRRVVAASLTGALAGAWGALPVVAAPLCTVTDPRLDEVSGLVATPTGYVALNDGTAGTTTMKLYRLNARCEVVGSFGDSGYDPFDTEDLGSTPDGTFWIADVGDNNRQRRQPAILRLPKGATQGTKYTLSYPDGPHDAEAILVQPDGAVVVVTKELSGVAGVFSAGPLAGPAATVPLRAAGTVTIPPSTTKGGPLEGATIVTMLITGGAVAPGGKRVVLRTYTDAYEWDVPNGDIAAALTSGVPTRTPLPGEPQGESISYTSDGASFVTLSEGVAQPLNRWVPAPRARPSPARSSPARSTPARSSPAQPAGTPGSAAQPAAPGPSWIPVAVGAALALAVAAVILATVLGLRGIRRRLRQRGA